MTATHAGGDHRRLRGLILDWGGVLTKDLDIGMAEWARGDGIRYEDFVAVLDGWVGRAPQACDPPPVALTDTLETTGPGSSPVHLLERGEIEPARFEEVLADALARRGSPVAPEGLLSRMLGELAELDPRMIRLVRAARSAGIRTALLSNSWGEHYPAEIFDGLFDAVVISGRVGMRKPERRIFDYAAEALGLPCSECVMVDDLQGNVRAAVGAGMVGVLHTSVETTLEEVEILLGVSTEGTTPSSG